MTDTEFKYFIDVVYALKGIEIMLALNLFITFLRFIAWMKD